MSIQRSIRNTKTLALRANDMRRDVVKALYVAGSGHAAGSLGMADIFSVLFFQSMRYDPKRPNWSERDRLILSNGHICPILYAAMSYAGYFSRKELMSLRKLGTRLQGHPHRTALPGLETTSGPLGSGLSQAAGMALVAQYAKKKHHVFVLTSDGEHQEGNTWEGVMFAAKYHLHNLIQIIDRNFIQIDGKTEQIMPLEPLDEKYRSFGWHVRVIDGHSYAEIIDAIAEAKKAQDKPSVIIANTVPGKGVTFMEHEYTWHGKPPKTKQELDAALHDLADVRKGIIKGTYSL